MLAFLTLALTLNSSDFCPDCVAADVDPPVVALRVLAPQKAADSGLITYRVIAINRATAKALDVKVKLDLPEKTTLHASTPEAEKVQNTLIWNIGTMPGKCQRQFEVTLKTQVDGPVEACFRISYEHGICVTTSSACKPPTKAGPDETLPVPKTAGQLTVQKIGPARQGMGTPILYSITVTNSGRIPLQQVELDDFFPPNAIYVPGTADNNGQLIGPEGKKMQWKLGTMLPSETRTVTFKVRPTQAGTYLNVASARAVDPDGQKVQSKDSTATTEISGMATLYMEVKDSQDPLILGPSHPNQLTSYTILVRNTGTAASTNIRLLADIQPGLVVTAIAPIADADASGFRTGDQRINFAPFALEARQEKLFRVEVRAEKAALFRFRSTLTADSLDPVKGPLLEEEITTVVNEKPPDSLTKLPAPGAGQLTKFVKE